MNNYLRRAIVLFGVQIFLLTTPPVLAASDAETRVLKCISTEQGPITRTGTIQLDMKRAKRILFTVGREIPIQITPATLSWEYVTPVPPEGTITIAEVIDRKTGILRASITHVKDGRVVTKKQEQSTCTGLE